MRISDWSSDVCSSDLEKGVPVLADGTQAVVHHAIDVSALDVDFYALTGHKLYGPTGIGALYAKPGWLERMSPMLGGGEMVATVGRNHVEYAPAPHKFEAGTPPILEAIGLVAALRSEEHTSELQSLMRNSYAVFCLKKKKKQNTTQTL